MPGIFSKKFHRQTDFNFTPGLPPLNPQYWPKEWSEIHHKEYPRFPKKELSGNLLDLGSLKSSLKNRHSQRKFDWTKEISFDELSTILHYSAGLKPSGEKDEVIRRFYPSGGARYPLEIYLAIQKVEGVDPGIYHFNIKNNSLETLTTDPEYMENLLEGLLYSWSRQAAVLVFTTAVWNRILVKYKNRGYRIALLEAGHLGHNLALTASALGIGCCNILGFNNQIINEVLDIEDEDEDSLYLTILGK